MALGGRNAAGGGSGRCSNSIDWDKHYLLLPLLAGRALPDLAPLDLPAGFEY